MIKKNMRIIVLFLTVIMSPVFAIEPRISNVILAVEVIYHQEIERAMKYAPAGKTNPQLRREAQKKSNAVFQQAALIYKIRVLRPKLDWGILRSSDGGEASVCFDRPFILMNEILFLHNFDETINETIPHEVAHVVTCLVHPEVAGQEDFDVHGSEWQAIAKSLGSRGTQYHELDTTPVGIYLTRIDLLDATEQKEKFLKEIDLLQNELDELIESLDRGKKDE